jgi:histidinol-phosphate aminotransferase
VFLSPGYQSVFSQHAFAVYPIASMSVGADLVAVPAVEFGHDLNAMLNAITGKTRVVWIANPNNPTGTWLNEAELLHFVEQVPSDVIILIDEAYSEYVRLEDYPDATQWITRFPNVIVTRTFSKAFGLAALRVGYSVSHPDVADLLNRVRQPFNVNSFAQAGALAALDDAEYLAESIRVNDEGLVQLSEGLDKLGLTYISSVGNFISVNVGRPVAEVDKALLMKGVITRPVENYGLQHHLRISVGLQSENARALTALEKVL